MAGANRIGGGSLQSSGPTPGDAGVGAGASFPSISGGRTTSSSGVRSSRPGSFEGPQQLERGRRSHHLNQLASARVAPAEMGDDAANLGQLEGARDEQRQVIEGMTFIAHRSAEAAHRVSVSSVVSTAERWRRPRKTRAFTVPRGSSSRLAIS